MKKILAAIFVACVCFAIAAPEAEAQPVVIFSNRCCDASDQMRCLQVNMTPLGSSCYCPYQGWGHTC